MAERWHDGVWLGATFNSNEHIVAMNDGKVVRARSVRGRPEGEKWSKEAIDLIKGVPWNPSAHDDKYDQDVIPRAPQGLPAILHLPKKLRRES